MSHAAGRAGSAREHSAQVAASAGQAPSAALLARHVSFCRALLALGCHTAKLARGRLPAMQAGDWEQWLAERECLVAQIRTQDGPQLVAETAAFLHVSGAQGGGGDRYARPTALALVVLLSRFRQRELALMHIVGRQEHLVAAAMRETLCRLSERLRAARSAQAARAVYCEVRAASSPPPEVGTG